MLFAMPNEIVCNGMRFYAMRCYAMKFQCYAIVYVEKRYA